jgi:hypothetical protein
VHHHICPPTNHEVALQPYTEAPDGGQAMLPPATCCSGGCARCALRSIAQCSVQYILCIGIRIAGLIMLPCKRLLSRHLTCEYHESIH